MSETLRAELGVDGELREAIAREVWVGFTGNPNVWDRAKDTKNDVVVHCWASADRVLALQALQSGTPK